MVMALSAGGLLGATCIMSPTSLSLVKIRATGTDQMSARPLAGMSGNQAQDDARLGNWSGGRGVGQSALIPPPPPERLREWLGWGWGR